MSRCRKIGQILSLGLSHKNERISFGLSREEKEQFLTEIDEGKARAAQRLAVYVLQDIWQRGDHDIIKDKVEAVTEAEHDKDPRAAQDTRRPYRQIPEAAHGCFTVWGLRSCARSNSIVGITALK